MIKHKDILPPGPSLVKDMLVAKSLDIAHLQYQTRCIYTEHKFVFTIEVADQFIKNDHQIVHFHATAVYQLVEALVNELHVSQHEQIEKTFSGLPQLFQN